MTLNFYTIGDWGKITTNLLNIAESMDEQSHIIKPDFILSLGDNFYPEGVLNTNDSKWSDYYTNVFTGSNLYCPWYAILGNHDYQGNPDAQVNYYLEKKDSRWIMPSRYYSVTYKFGDKTIQIVAIDTVEIALLTSSLLMTDHQIKSSNINHNSKNNQLIWLENILSQSTADWLIVMGHYNLYTAGYHGSNHEMIRILKPLFVKYHIDMYICGHCHNLEHLTDHNIEYIVSGSGTKNGLVGKIFQSKFGSGSCGYTIHQINNNIMTTSFLDQFSTVLYSFNIEQKRNKN